MNIKKFIRKNLLLNSICGHIGDAYIKKIQSNKDFSECLKESVKETICEDAPGTSQLYNWGKYDGKKEGIKYQAKVDSEKIEQIKSDHDNDRKEWKEINEEKDKLIGDLAKQFDANQ